MYSKKQRIISFLTAFLLIFTFVFINPLTVSKSHAVLPAVTLTANGIRIIAGVIVSSGLGIVAGQALQEVDYQAAVTAISNVVYRTLNGAEKIALMALSIIDNVVEVPISLYNSIMSKAQELFNSSSIPTLAEQGFSIRYAINEPSSINYPDIVVPFYNYNGADNLSSSYYSYDYEKYIMDGAVPFFVYDGRLVTDGSTDLTIDGVSSFIYELGTDEFPLYTPNTSLDMTGYEVFTTNLTPYNLSRGSNSPFNAFTLYSSGNVYELHQSCFWSINDEARHTSERLFTIQKGYENINNYIIESYLIYSSNYPYVLTNVKTHDGVVIYQDLLRNTNYNGIFNKMLTNRQNVNYTTYDTTISVEESPTQVVPNANSSANVITLPTDLSGSIGITSTDVNVSTGTGEGSGTNTETMENINTNVGELVTGGELGEQINTNIGTVEGLHGELTDKADFTGLMDILAEYISFMNISSISWLTTAIPLIVTPFIPFISLGMILFFIDRVLNGGA